MALADIAWATLVMKSISSYRLRGLRYLRLYLLLIKLQMAFYALKITKKTEYGNVMHGYGSCNEIHPQLQPKKSKTKLC